MPAIICSQDGMPAMEKKNKALMAAAVIAIVAALAASYFLLPDSSHEPRAKIFPQPIEDGDKEYPTAAEAQEQYGLAMASLKSSLSDSSLGTDAMSKAISSAESARDTLKDKFNWVALDYSRAPSRMSSEYQAWEVFSSGISDSLAVAVKDALSGPCAGTVEAALKALGEDPEDYRAYGEITPEEKALLQRQTELKAQYEAVMGTEYTATDSQGRTWTLAEVAQSTVLTIEEKERLVKEIYAAQFADAAEVYVQLVQANNRYAQLLGYGSYTEYAYKERFARDYLPSDAESFGELAAQAYYISRNACDLSGHSRESCVKDTEWLYKLDADGLIEASAPFIRSMSKDHSRLLDYMVEYGLINICFDNGRSEDAYTADIRTRGSALVYIGKSSLGPLTETTLIHEFGHSTNVCLTPDRSSCFDVMEIHSQGLEALYCASGLVGNGSDAAVRVMELSTLMSVMSESAILTEFEIWAYKTEAETGSLAAGQACDKFGEILDSHGIVYSTPYDQKYAWANIPHLFQSPHYYISYGTSVLNAMEIYLEALDDYGSAKEKYMSLLYQEDVGGYVEAVEKAGLSNMLDIGKAKKVIDGIEDALKAMKG